MNLLAGDLGGTKTLLAIFNCSVLPKKIHQRHYISTDWDSLNHILDHFFDNLPSHILMPSQGCLGVAGPVMDGYAKITNLGWEVSEKEIIKSTNLKRLELVNDFCVLIYGIPFLSDNQYVTIQSTLKGGVQEGVTTILGAGTGLGIAKGLINKNDIIALPSEGGHQEFAPRSSQEWKLAEWLKKDLNQDRLSVERIISGTGLGNIAKWRLSQSDAMSHPLRRISEEWQSTTQNHTNQDLPAMASQSAKNGDPLMNEVLNIWLSAYGSAAGDLALQELPTAGLWIGGGTANKHIDGLHSNSFLKAFQNKGRFRDFLSELPVMALVDPEVGVFSAACRARLLAKSSEKLIE